MDFSDILAREAPSAYQSLIHSADFVRAEVIHSRALVQALVAHAADCSVELRKHGFCGVLELVSLPKNVRFNEQGQFLSSALSGTTCDVACSNFSAIQQLSRSVGGKRYIGIDLLVSSSRVRDADREEIFLEGDALEVLSQMRADTVDLFTVCGLECRRTGEFVPMNIRMGDESHENYLSALVHEMAAVVRKDGFLLFANNGEQDSYLMRKAASRLCTEIPLFPEIPCIREELDEARRGTLEETFTTIDWIKYVRRWPDWTPDLLRSAWVFQKKAA